MLWCQLLCWPHSGRALPRDTPSRWAHIHSGQCLLVIIHVARHCHCSAWLGGEFGKPAGCPWNRHCANFTCALRRLHICCTGFNSWFIDFSIIVMTILRCKCSLEAQKLADSLKVESWLHCFWQYSESFCSSTNFKYLWQLAGEVSHSEQVLLLQVFPLHR